MLRLHDVDATHNIYSYSKYYRKYVGMETKTRCLKNNTAKIYFRFHEWSTKQMSKDEWKTRETKKKIRLCVSVCDRETERIYQIGSFFSWMKLKGTTKEKGNICRGKKLDWKVPKFVGYFSFRITRCPILAKPRWFRLTWPA